MSDPQTPSAAAGGTASTRPDPDYTIYISFKIGEPIKQCGYKKQPFAKGYKGGLENAGIFKELCGRHTKIYQETPSRLNFVVKQPELLGPTFRSRASKPRQGLGSQPGQYVRARSSKQRYDISDDDLFLDSDDNQKPSNPQRRGHFETRARASNDSQKIPNPQRRAQYETRARARSY
ncbi:MAG: hypothetical protein Q9169_003812 [Polycauliona sp. 2 TL-2023]